MVLPHVIVLAHVRVLAPVIVLWYGVSLCYGVRPVMVFACVMVSACVIELTCNMVCMLAWTSSDVIIDNCYTLCSTLNSDPRYTFDFLILWSSSCNLTKLMKQKVPSILLLSNPLVTPDNSRRQFASTPSKTLNSSSGSFYQIESNMLSG